MITQKYFKTFPKMHHLLTLPSAEPEQNEQIWSDFVNERDYVSVTRLYAANAH